MISRERRREIVDALRRGTVPARGLEALAVGLDRFAAALDAEFDAVARSGGGFKAVRGEYGSGKTFFARWVAERARKQRFATAEIQISETETPLHRLETVYRRLMERLSTAEAPDGALRSVVESWFFTLEQDALAEGQLDERDTAALLARTHQLLEMRLAAVARRSPAFAAALRTYREAAAEGDAATAEALLAWLAGQPNVGAAAKRRAGLKGEVDHSAALNFLEGWLLILRDSGYRGLVVVLDELETLQRMRTDVRDRSLNALRQLLDEIDAGRFPGLYLFTTGTAAFFDGPMGVERLPPLAQRLRVEWGDPRFDNPRAVQVRLPAFNLEALAAVGRRVRDLFAEGSPVAERIHTRVDDDTITVLARAVAGELGGKVGVAPRVFLKKLVGEVLDIVELYADFDPRRDYRLTISRAELTREEAGAATPDDVELSL